MIKVKRLGNNPESEEAWRNSLRMKANLRLRLSVKVTAVIGFSPPRSGTIASKKTLTRSLALKWFCFEQDEPYDRPLQQPIVRWVVFSNIDLDTAHGFRILVVFDFHQYKLFEALQSCYLITK